MTTNLNQLPTDLPIPQDDGSTNHLKGMKLPNVSLIATNGKTINLGRIKGKLVIYCYPMTGQPNVALPDGWDQIPGARGCTPQSCSFRDHYQDLQALGAEVLGLSVQTTEYQKEMADRLHLPFPVVSDVNYEFQKALNMPTFVAAGNRKVSTIADEGFADLVAWGGIEPGLRKPNSGDSLNNLLPKPDHCHLGR